MPITTDQPTLFSIPGEPEPATPPPTSDAPVSPTAKPKPKRGHGRRRLPDDLPRERVVHDLLDAEKVCPCCRSVRVKMGEETSEQLDYRPASLFVREHVRLKYACTKCLQNRPDGASDTAVSPIVVAPKPPQPIDGGLPGPGLLAHVVVSKFCDHLPLHRQESILARHGVELARSTMCDWVAAVANLLLPIYLAMRSDTLLSRVVQTDETRVPVQDPGSRKTKSGRLWVYVGDRNHPHLVYDYTPDRSRDGPAKVLKDYRGYLQADAASVFDGLCRPGGIVEVGCWAHARRYFHEARDSDPVRSAEALARIGAFYGIEDEAGERANARCVSNWASTPRTRCGCSTAASGRCRNCRNLRRGWRRSRRRCCRRVRWARRWHTRSVSGRRYCGLRRPATSTSTTMLRSVRWR